MEREFRESEGFTRLVKTGALVEEQVRQLQRDIIAGRGQVIPRTGGFRKIRVAGAKAAGDAWFMPTTRNTVLRRLFRLALKG